MNAKALIAILMGLAIMLALFEVASAGPCSSYLIRLADKSGSDWKRCAECCKKSHYDGYVGMQRGLAIKECVCT